MRYTAYPLSRLDAAILDLTGATLAGFAIAHVVIACRNGFTAITAIALAIVAVLFVAILLYAQRTWIELRDATLVRGRGPFQFRRDLRRSQIYFTGIESDRRGYHLAICLRGGERMRIGRGLAYADLHQLRARLRA